MVMLHAIPMFETELKFQVPPERVAAVRAAMARAVPRRQRLRALYVDTPEGTLASAGIALRVRQEGPRWVQTLKARGAHAAERHEHNVTLPRQPAGALPPAVVPARHAGTPAAAAWAAALGQSIEAFDATRLQPVMETDIARRAVRVADPAGGVVELAFDEGEVRAGGAVARVCELEYELVEGSLADLARQAAEGVALHGLWLDTVSKAERGELLARGRAWPEAERFTAPRLPGHPDGEALWRAALASALAMMLPNASALATGSAEPEHVHQLRIGIRRLRTAVQELGPLVRLGSEPAWLAPLVALFRALGAGRDEAALRAGLAPRLRAAGAPAVDWQVGEQPPPAAPGELVRAEAAAGPRPAGLAGRKPGAAARHAAAGVPAASAPAPGPAAPPGGPRRPGFRGPAGSRAAPGPQARQALALPDRLRRADVRAAQVDEALRARPRGRAGSAGRTPGPADGLAAVPQRGQPGARGLVRLRLAGRAAAVRRGFVCRCAARGGARETLLVSREPGG